MRSDKSSMFFFAVKICCSEVNYSLSTFVNSVIGYSSIKRKKHKKATRAIYVNMKNAGIATVDRKCRAIVKCV